MSDKILSEEEHELQKVRDDYFKENMVAKYMHDIEVMSRLIASINEYILVFGRTSNVHDQLVDLKAQVKINRDHLSNWMNAI